MLSPILGPFQGFALDLLGGIRYDEALFLKEDYDMSLRVLQRYHKVLRFNGYHYAVDQQNKRGGQVSMRTMAEERKQLRLLKERWGGRVVHTDRKKQKGNEGFDINPVVKCPLKGI